jgi:hypothetical protein
MVFGLRVRTQLTAMFCGVLVCLNPGMIAIEPLTVPASKFAYE